MASSHAHAIAASSPYAGAAVLVVDDDPAMVETTSLVLRYLGLRVLDADSGAAAIAVARRERLDLALIDWRLPDMSGLDVVRALRAERITVPWVLISAFMDFDAAREAGRLGALDAVSAPYDVEEVVFGALAKIKKTRGIGWPQRPISAGLREFHSVVDECACLIWRACDSEDDVRTVGDWARAVGKGYSTLRALCYRADIAPEAAKDCARVLRALAETGGRVASLESHLRYGDDRTLGPLLERAGLAARTPSEVLAVEDYLAAQRFIAADHPVLAAIRALVADP